MVRCGMLFSDAMVQSHENGARPHNVVGGLSTTISELCWEYWPLDWRASLL